MGVTGRAETGLAAALSARQADGNPVRVGVIGAGEMGTDLVTQIARMDGIDIAAIVDRSGVNALSALDIAGIDRDHGRPVETVSQMEQAIHAGKMAITADAGDLCQSEQVDVVIDATGKPAVGAEYGLMAMNHGKHLVMMNVEADVTIGPYLKAAADRLGVIYTIGAGDEPSSTLELIDFVTALGYPVVAAGKGKNNPFNPDAVPDDYRVEAARRNMNPRMLVEFVDGSKTMVEMAAIANATGLVPDKPGMHGPAADLDDLHHVFCPETDGGILSRKGCVDFSIGRGVAPGIFVVAELDHPRLRERMNDLKLGEGPYYTFYRPYHLTSLEVPLSAARAVIYQTADMTPRRELVAEVCALAKRDLAPGERLDAIGETCYRSWTMTADDARRQAGLPVGLLEGGRVTKAVSKGALITAENTQPDTSTALYAMRLAQDEMSG